ncbi:putative pectinesterase/pectinesterase inhibitor 34-like [Dorcoceras hygrometricum]|uniref:Pectinesterase n=1 Tax=Dorcoceras hygrometricum TaxID=472368 RepID=A0A2Z7BGE3_9LAMI|nr:putative pectinesterase/pectinesterase inhibitor 34-like [Dorcoceras hygrometricum]
MDYGRLGPAEPKGSSAPSVDSEPNLRPRKSKLKLVLILAATLMVASAVCAVLVVTIRNTATAAKLHRRRPSQAMSRTCGKTLYPSLCLDSLIDFPGALAASEKDLVHISVNMTLQRVDRALYHASEFTNLPMGSHERSAYEACLELLDESVDLLTRSLLSVVPGGGDDATVTTTQDILTWISASLTYHETCNEGFEELTGDVKNQMSDRLQDLSELVSNSLAIYNANGVSDDFSEIPIQNRRRRLLGSVEKHGHFPAWLSRKDRMLLDLPVTALSVDIIVSKDGNGTHKTIAEAIKKVPDHSTRRTIIYVKAGKYEEDNLKVGRKKTNVMFIGDGKGKTIISGGRNIFDKITTFHTASFAATGSGFIARDISFENWAGPSKHQAVALRIGADHAVIFRCNIIGFQDTLYVHSQRQFYRECDIYGTVDFIFGNAAAVIQSCTIHARKPMALQKNTITAQNRKDPNQNTGISIHACKLVAEPDLERVKGAYPTYLGRPWKMYSRTVYMLSDMGDHIHPRGWLEWNATFALDTLYYGEYMNFGPGSTLGQRVKWPGYRVIKSTEEAGRFTVAQFISGSSWLPSTGVAFVSGLSS